MYSEKTVIEKVKDLLNNNNDLTFENAVDIFINETFGDPHDSVHADGVESLILDMNQSDEFKKLFNDDQFKIIIAKLELWQDRYFRPHWMGFARR